MKVQRIINFGLAMCVCMWLTSGCYYDNEEELYGTTTCDTTAVTYTADIKPLLDLQCNSCHSTSSNLGGVALETYDQVKVYVTNGGLLGSINHDSNYSPMPQGTSKLSNCNISKVRIWINAGALNN